MLFPALLLLATGVLCENPRPTARMAGASPALAAPAEQRRDPLTENESDQVRELAQEPDKRIKLLVKFISARMETIEQVEGDPRMAAGRGKQVHDLLQDFTELIDELDDNVDDYVDKRADIRKALKDVIEANTSFQLKLRTLQEQKAGSKEYGDFGFVLQDATDAVNGSLDNSRQALDELEKALKDEKKKK